MTFPLDVEMFGVWSPFALEALHSTADHSTARSSTSTRLAHKNTLQQLSVLTLVE